MTGVGLGGHQGEGDWERGSGGGGLQIIGGREVWSMAPLVLAWEAIRGREVGSMALLVLA